MARTDRYARAAQAFAVDLDRRILTVVTEQLDHGADYTDEQMDLMDARWHAWSDTARYFRQVRSARGFTRAIEHVQRSLEAQTAAASPAADRQLYLTELAATLTTARQCLAFLTGSRAALAST